MKWVLIVEPAEYEYRYLERIISRLGYRPYRAGSGREGLHYLSESLPNALICGEKLPDIDPVSFCTQIKSEPLTAHLPALLATSNQDSTLRSRATSAGFADVVYRPLSIRNFFQLARLIILTRLTVS